MRRGLQRALGVYAPRRVGTAEFAKELEGLLREQLAATHVEVLDESADHAGHKGARENPGAGHFKATVVSVRFDGLGLVARHRLVNDVVGARFRDAVHALSITARTPAEWAR